MRAPAHVRVAVPRFICLCLCVCVGLAASPALQCDTYFDHMAPRWIFALGGVAPSHPPPPVLPALCFVVLCCVVLCCVVLCCVRPPHLQVPPVLVAVSVHDGILSVVEAGLACLHQLAQHKGSQGSLAAALPTLAPLLTSHGTSPTVVEHG